MADLHAVMRGRVWKLGDSVDTSQLGRGGSQSSAGDDLKAYCLRALRPEFAAQVQSGDLLVAGENFGCGSSRQTAVQALQECGIQAVLAESMARIYRRNSIALGLPAYVVPGIGGLVADGGTLEVDYAQGVVRNAVSGRHLPLARFPASVEEIYRSGGLSRLIVDKLARRGIVPEA